MSGSGYEGRKNENPRGFTPQGLGSLMKGAETANSPRAGDAWISGHRLPRNCSPLLYKSTESIHILAHELQASGIEHACSEALSAFLYVMESTVPANPYLDILAMLCRPMGATVVAEVGSPKHKRATENNRNKRLRINRSEETSTAQHVGAATSAGGEPLWVGQRAADTGEPLITAPPCRTGITVPDEILTTPHSGQGFPLLLITKRDPDTASYDRLRPDEV
jgi:hypothetical protein